MCAGCRPSHPSSRLASGIPGSFASDQDPLMSRASLLVIVLIPLLATAFALPAGQPTAPSITADTVLLHGKIWTVNPTQPEAQAIAVLGERVVLVGKDDDAKRLIGPKTRVIDLQQKRVVPGFHDSHVHLLSSGIRL